MTNTRSSSNVGLCPRGRVVGREDLRPKFVTNFLAPLSLSLCLHEMGMAPSRLLQGLKVFCDLQRAT